jgi:myo-inositol-1(or 4)-monophosphatase
MHPTLTIAVRAARRAGRIITRAAEDLDHIKVDRKQANDFVTEVDRQSEQAIIETLIDAFPHHSFMGEETGATHGKPYETPEQADFLWIIDPLDGTTNFIHGMPQYAVSIALMERGQLTQALVYDPNRDELFAATRGRGAFLNDRRIRVSKRTKLDETVIGTGFPYRRMDALDQYMEHFKLLTQRCAGIRRPGAAALDLAYVASGRYDGFFEIGLKPWDVAAGALLVIEAGGMIGNFSNEPDYVFNEEVIAASPKIYEAMMKLIGHKKSRKLLESAHPIDSNEAVAPALHDTGDVAPVRKILRVKGSA